MKRSLKLCGMLVVLAGCASTPKPVAKLEAPAGAPSREDLVAKMPPGTFMGSVDGHLVKDGLSSEVIFFKEPLEKVPSLIAVYQNDGEKLKLVYSAPSPFGKDACAENQCVFRFASYPYPLGFEISMVEVVGPQMRQDMLFKWEDGDFRLIRRNVSWPGLARDGRGTAHLKCSQSEDLVAGHRFEVVYPLERKTAMASDQLQPHFLRQDAIKFANANEPNACEALGEKPPGFSKIR